MNALEKVLAAAGQDSIPAATQQEDPAADLVAAAQELLTELVIELSKNDPDNDGDDDSTAKGDTDHDYWTKGGKRKKPLPGKGKKKPKGKGASDDDDDEDDDDEAEDQAEVKKKVKAAGLAAGALLALAGLDGRPEGYDWVEATSAPLTPAEALRLAKGDDDDHPAPYGAVEYADPGYRGKKRYPIDAKHIHAALSYFSQAKNRAEYTASQVKAIWGRIKAAAKKHGVQVAGEGKTAAASHVSTDALVALAAAASDGGVPMQHPPFSGRHNHPHSVMNVHSHAHDHNNDSRHECGASSYGAY